VYEEEPFYFFSILSEEKLKKGECTVRLLNTLEQTSDSLVVEIDHLNVIESEEGNDFSLAAKKLIEQISLFGTKEEKSKDKIDISVKIFCSFR
jgi:hypothetical protein